MLKIRITASIMLLMAVALLISGCGKNGEQNYEHEIPATDEPPAIVADQTGSVATEPPEDNAQPADGPGQHEPPGDEPPDEPSDEPPGEPPDEPPEDSGEYKAAYLDILNEVGAKYVSWADIVESGITSVSIADLTNDGTPELFFTEIDGGDINFSIYGYNNGQARRLLYLEQLARTEDVEHYEAYSTSDGRVIAYGSSSNLRNSASDYYVINSFSQSPVGIELSIKWTYGHSDVDVPDYFIDGELVTKDEYDEKLEQIFDGAEKRLAFDGFASLREETSDVSMSFREASEFLSD